MKDDSYEIRKSAVNSSLLLFASPLILVFPSSTLEEAIDKMIPIVLPFSLLGQAKSIKEELREVSLRVCSDLE